MARALDADWVASYARAPAQTTLDRAISLHNNVRELLGETGYATFLQGSYKNDTALADMNDVDVVVVNTNIRQKRFWSDYDWGRIFSGIEDRLQSDSRYRDKWKRHDKCITLNTTVKIDIVPAIHVDRPEADPIAIFSFSRERERKNWPRLHYENGAKKSRATDGAYKPSVRLFKRWAKCHFAGEKIAPSYYLECLLHSLPTNLFSADLAQGFVALGREIVERYRGLYTFQDLDRIAGEGNLLVEREWGEDAFKRFIRTLTASVEEAEAALRETESLRAKAAWRRAFYGFEP